MNRKQFLIAVFTALIGAKRWRKLFPPKLCFARRAFMPVGSLFNPSADLVAQYMKPLRFHPDAFVFTYPKIGDTLNLRVPVKFSMVNPDSAKMVILG